MFTNNVAIHFLRSLA